MHRPPHQEKDRGRRQLICAKPTREGSTNVVDRRVASIGAKRRAQKKRGSAPNHAQVGYNLRANARLDDESAATAGHEIRVGVALQ